MDIRPDDKGVPDDIGDFVPELFEGRDRRRIRVFDSLQYARSSMTREIQG